MSDLHAALMQFFFGLKKSLMTFMNLFTAVVTSAKNCWWWQKKIAHNSCCCIQVTIKTKANEYWIRGIMPSCYRHEGNIIFSLYDLPIRFCHVVVSIVCLSIHKNRYNSLQYWSEFKVTCYSDDLHTDFSQTQRHICRSQWISIQFLMMMITCEQWGLVSQWLHLSPITIL